jgi:hypothetical protein
MNNLISKMHATSLVAALLHLAFNSTLSQQLPPTGKLIPEADGICRLHTIVPGSKGNTIVLSLSIAENGGGSQRAGLGSDSVMVICVKRPLSLGAQGAPELVIVTPASKVVPAPATDGHIDVTFSVDISKEIDTKEIDTLNFIVIGRGGALVRKTILLTYSTPTRYLLEQNYPNPFNPSTTIGYDIPGDSRVSIRIYDVLGRDEVLIIV